MLFLQDELLIDSTEWKLEKADAKKSMIYYDCCSEPYPDVTFTFVVARKSPSYKAIIITPTFGNKLHQFLKAKIALYFVTAF